MNSQVQGEIFGEELGRIVSAEFLADCLSVSRPTISKLQKEGLPKLAYGKFDLKDCVAWYVARSADKSSDGDNDKTKEQRLKLLVAQTDRTELESQKLRGEMIPFEVHKTILNSAVSTFAASLEGFAPRHANRFASMTDAAMIQEEILSECRSIRSSVAGTLVDAAINAVVDSGTGDIGTTTVEDSGSVGGRETSTA